MTTDLVYWWIVAGLFLGGLWVLWKGDDDGKSR